MVSSYSRKVGLWFTVTFWAFAHCLMADDPMVDTIRFYTKRSKPEQIQSYAISPDGRYLAISFDRDNSGSAAGVSVVDLKSKRLLGRFGHFSFGALAFNSDSSEILGIGGYAGIVRVEHLSGRVRQVGESSAFSSGSGRPRSSTGLPISESNGKLVIAKGDDPPLAKGDELLAIYDGEVATKYNDNRRWRSLLGKGRREALEMLDGHPKTWVTVKYLKAGTTEKRKVSVLRQPLGDVAVRPSLGKCIAHGRVGGDFLFFSADTGKQFAAVTLRDTTSGGKGAISPNGKLFAWIGKVVGSKKKCLEVYSLENGRVVYCSGYLDMTIQDIRFSANSKHVLIGTRDTVEVFGLVDSGKWLEPISLVPESERDSGRVVSRRIPGGLGFPGDFYVERSTVQYASPAVLSKLTVSQSGTVAIASETGCITLTRLDGDRKIRSVSKKEFGAVELIEMTANDRQLIVFAKGNLSIVDLGSAQQLSEGTVASAD